MKKFSRVLLICILFHCNISSVNASNIQSLEVEHGTVINQMAVRMLTDCYMDSKRLVIHGDTDQSTFKSIRDTQIFRVTTIISSSSTINIGVEQQTTMSILLMSPNSVKHFRDILMTFKNSQWWNIMNPFFILDKSNQKCENARDILESAWEMNVVKSFFLCVDSNRVPLIYTYNPYTNRAPQPWKEAPSIQKKTSGWTMYFQSYYEGDYCEALNFDRTKYLDGSVIRIVVNLLKQYTWISNKDYDETIMKKINSYEIKVTKAMKQALNVTLVFNIAEDKFNRLPEEQGFYQRLKNKSSDIAISWRTPYSLLNFTMSYPAARSKYYITTNNQGFYTPWEKIKNYYGMVTLVSMCIILIMTFSVVVLSGKERKWSFAGFEVLRLIVNAAIHSRMNTTSRRIFFTMNFLYFLIIHATFQGRLSAFLTKNEYRKNVEKVEDLRDSRYHAIHVSPEIVPIITDPILKAKLVVGHPNCTRQILGNNSCACIADYFFLQKVVFEHKLHLSKNPISSIQYVYATREDWPLKKRIDMFLMRLEQSRFSHRWHQYVLQEENARQKRIIATTKIYVRPISLPMLEFAFVIFVIGLTLAIVCFSFEKSRIKHVFFWKKQNNRVQRKILNVRRPLKHQQRLTRKI